MSKEDRDSLGSRMKEYEFRETERRFFQTLPVYARIDGRGFSKFTKGMERPYDIRMTNAMVDATKLLVDKTHARIGYVQSDEISLVWMAADYDKGIFFDGKIQKMVSVLAGLATAAFNEALENHFPNARELQAKMPHFDARVLQLPNPVEAANMFLWRELDAFKNAISMAAHHHFSHKSLQGMSGAQMQERLFREAGINFNDYPAFFKRGTWVRRTSYERTFTPEELAKIKPEFRPAPDMLVTRSEVRAFELPPFSKITNKAGVIFDAAEPMLSE